MFIQITTWQNNSFYTIPGSYYIGKKFKFVLYFVRLCLFLITEIKFCSFVGLSNSCDMVLAKYIGLFQLLAVAFQ